nr:Chain E, Meditope [synthetic construct]5I2I_F Chain F, Meditope [synthetic construct]
GQQDLSTRRLKG